MPNGDLEPIRRERELKRAATLLVYLKKQIGGEVEPWMHQEAEASYPTDERSVTELYATLKALNSQQREDIVYNARDKTARNLADWWEEHQVADRAREERELIEKESELLREQGLAKLTPEERRALGRET